MVQNKDVKNIIQTIINGTPSQQFCVVCLLPVKDLHEDVFTRICSEDNEFSVAEVLDNICGVKLPLSDCNKICYKCLKLATTTYKFYSLSQQSHKIFDFFVNELSYQISTVDSSNKQATILLPDLFKSNRVFNDKAKTKIAEEKSLAKGELRDLRSTGGKQKGRWKRKPMTSTPCTRCPVKYRFLVKLKQHMRMEHGIEIHICEVCKACIEDEQEFQNHLKTHSNLHICDKCNMVFKRREAIINHLQWHENIKNLIKSDQGIICEICGLVFENDDRLAEHHESTHVKNYTCFYCGKMYKYECGFEAHIKKHELTNAKNGSIDKPKDMKQKEGKRKKFTCSHCGKAFKHERSLMFHERLHTNERPYTCEVCGRAFVTLNRRNQHALCAHTAPARRCPLCPALFHLRSMINTHIKKVHLKSHKRRQRSPKFQNVYWKTETVPIQELSVSIQDEVFNLDNSKHVEYLNLNLPKPGIRKYGTKNRYTEELLEKALDDIRNYRISQRKASEVFNIPYSTIKYKLKGLHSMTVGKPPVLSNVEENFLVSHILALSELGIPVGEQDVRVIVKKYLDDNKRQIKEFKNNLPGHSWCKLFLERQFSIKQEIDRNISRKRAQVTQQTIETFFDNLAIELENVPPSNIFNFDEIGFHDDLIKQNLLFRRQYRNPELIKNSKNSCYTVMFCGNAVGELVPLYVIYKAKQKWSEWLMDAPPDTRMAVTPTGWIDAGTFDDWFEHQLLPVLKEKEGKKVIIGDYLSSHITPKCLQLCAENDVKFICPIPNSTHLLQPLDVYYFSELKKDWRSILQAWMNTKRGRIALPKPVFATLLNKTIEAGEYTAAQNVVAGFRACGLHPLNRNEVLLKLEDYSEPLEEDSLLEIQQKRKFQKLGESLSDGEKCYHERKTKKTKKTSGIVKKKGRPAGSKYKTLRSYKRAKDRSPVAGPSNIEQLPNSPNSLPEDISSYQMFVDNEIEISDNSLLL